ncbi:protein of unknown function [Clostridium beijerinckii]|nr:protein of unknown function [Clostridium beijerinckii]
MIHKIKTTQLCMFPITFSETSKMEQSSTKSIIYSDFNF